MRIYVASDKETLRTIAVKYKINLESVKYLNPLITDPDMNITGKHVKITDEITSYRKNEYFPLTPPRPAEYAEHWIPITPLEKMAQTDYDVLIVGTGAGGGAAVWRLCEQWGRNGKRVGVVEAGDLLLPTHVFNIPTYNVDQVRNIWLNPKYLKRILEAYSNNGSSPVPVEYNIVKVLGGKTLHWGAATPRMVRADLSQWPVTFREMEQYYNIAEQVMTVTGFFAGGSSLQEVMLARLQANGFPDVTACPRAVDLQPTLYGHLHSNVFFSSIIFLAAAMNRRPFDLAIQSRTVQVLVEKGRVAGIQVMSSEKKSYVLKAKTVVLAAGTLETPRILLYSGIKGEAIGHYLANHSRLDAEGYVKRSGFPEDLGILDLLVPRTEARPFQIQIGWLEFYQYKEKPLIENLKVTLLTQGIVESRYDNRITLDPVRKDEYGVPEPRVHFSYSEKDFELIRQSAEGVKHAASAMKVSLVEEDGRPKITLRRPGGENHETGTCRMGDDPAASATNQYGQIHGVSGLFVADNSIIPTTGAANPTLTTVALAIRTADYIVEQSK